MECGPCSPSRPFVVLPVDRFVGHGGSPLERQKQDSRVYRKTGILPLIFRKNQSRHYINDEIQNDWQKSFIRKNPVVRHVTRPCPCMTTSIIIKITRVISMWTLHWITVGCHGVESPMTTGYYCAIFPFCFFSSFNNDRGLSLDDKTNDYVNRNTLGLIHSLHEVTQLG